MPFSRRCDVMLATSWALRAKFLGTCRVKAWKGKVGLEASAGETGGKLEVIWNEMCQYQSEL